MSDLPVANYLELAAGFHMICLLANPAEATRAVYCSCGWKSKPEKWPYDVDSYESLVSQVKLHFKQALSELRKERKEEQRRRDRGDFNYTPTPWHLRWHRFLNQSASQFLQGVTEPPK